MASYRFYGTVNKRGCKINPPTPVPEESSAAAADPKVPASEKKLSVTSVGTIRDVARGMSHRVRNARVSSSRGPSGTGRNVWVRSAVETRACDGGFHHFFV